MADTNRNIVRYKKVENEYSTCDNTGFEAIVVDETRAKHQNIKNWRGTKLKPYVKSGGQQYKFRWENEYNNVPTQQAKLVVKNANRSLKKGKRQELKRELQREIDNALNRIKNGK